MPCVSPPRSSAAAAIAVTHPRLLVHPVEELLNHIAHRGMVSRVLKDGVVASLARRLLQVVKLHEKLVGAEACRETGKGDRSLREIVVRDHMRTGWASIILTAPVSCPNAHIRAGIRFVGLVRLDLRVHYTWHIDGAIRGAGLRPVLGHSTREKRECGEDKQQNGRTLQVLRRARAWVSGCSMRPSTERRRATVSVEFGFRVGLCISIHFRIRIRGDGELLGANGPS